MSADASTVRMGPTSTWSVKFNAGKTSSNREIKALTDLRCPGTYVP